MPSSSGDYWFDDEAATKACRFFGHLRHMKGGLAGKPFALQPWQRDDIVRPMFGCKRPDGTRRYRIAYLEIPRGGGKSTLAAGLALYLLFCDGESGAEVYSVASDRDQALLVFDPACWMVRHAPMLDRRCQIYEASKKIVYREKGSVYKAIAADAAGSHGFNAHAVIYDEIHAAKSRELYDVLLTSMGKREQPLMIITTTAGHDRGSICWELHQHAKRVLDNPDVDPSFLPVIYAADPEDDWTDEAVWDKANPNLDISIKRDYLREQCARAKENPALENVFRNLHLNQWTEQAIRFLPMHEWDECKGEVDEAELEGQDCYAALDLASTRDLCALALLFPVEDRFKVLLKCWAPSEARTARDRQDKQSYAAWADRKLISLTDGNVADYEQIRGDLFALSSRFNIHKLIFDPWNATEFYQSLIREGWPEDKLLEFRQSFANYNEPTKRLLELVKGRKIEHGGNPLLRWMASNLAVKTDPSGNLRPDKSKSSDKIDGMTALLMALGVALTEPPEPQFVGCGIHVLSDPYETTDWSDDDDLW